MPRHNSVRRHNEIVKCSHSIINVAATNANLT